MKTRKLLNVYISASLTYLVAQGLLNLFAYYVKTSLGLKILYLSNFYFKMIGISAGLIIISYFIMKKFYHRKGPHYILYTAAWFFLFIPQIIPQLFYGLSIIYITWTFVLVTTVAGSIAFQDLILVNANNVVKKERKFIYKDLKFYLDKLAIAWLALGSILAICMTILWTAPPTSFEFSYIHRVVLAVYMVFCFLVISILVGLFVGFPTLQSLKKIRSAIINLGYKNSMN